MCLNLGPGPGPLGRVDGGPDNGRAAVGPWAGAHGPGPMGQGPWAHGPGPMGQGPGPQAHVVILVIILAHSRHPGHHPSLEPQIW